MFRKLTLLTTMLVVGLSQTPETAAQTTFSRHTISNSLTGAYWVYSRDIDKDGDLDLVTASNNGIDWWRNDGNQNFSKRFAASLQGAWGAHAEDIDGDGDVDLLGCSPATDEVLFLRNNGSQSFTRVVIDNQGLDPESVYAADLDGDGDRDVMTALWEDKKVVWYEYLGGTSFAKRVLDSFLSGAHSVTAADLDGDGDQDVIASGSSQTRWYRNNGQGSFTKITLTSAGGWAVSTGDIDGDGDLDILRTQRNNGDVDWLRNNGGSFTEINIESGYGECWSIVAGDLDGDGDLDVAGAGFGANNIKAWFNLGGGDFGPGVIVDNVNVPRAVDIADLDKDGDGDIPAAIRGDRDLAWYEATGSPTRYSLQVTTQGAGSVALNPPGGTYIPGTVVQLTATPSSGWQFSGWSGALTGTANPATVTMNANKTVTATFTQISPQQVTLTVNTQGSGTVALNPPGGTYAVGTVVLLTATPASGWQFSGWSGALSGSANPASITMDANKTVTAIFTQGGGGPLTFNPTDDGQVKVTEPGLNFGTKATTKVEVNRFRSYFKFNVSGLTGTVQSAVLRLFVSGASVDGGDVYPVPNNYRGTSTPWVESGLTAANSPLNSGPALDNPGPVVLGTIAEWDVTSAVNGNGIVSFAVASKSADQAKYDTKEGEVIPQLVVQTAGGPPQYTLTTSTQGSGSVSLNPPGGTYAAGTVVQLTATPAAGWQFSGWSGDLTGAANPASLTMDANKNVTATFTQIPPQQVTLTVTTQGSGTVVLNPPGGTYNVGTVVQLTATPASGWQFSGWSGDLTGTANPASLTMDANKNVTATFAQIPPQQVTLTVTAQGSGTVALNPPGGTYNVGTVVQLTATPASGWQFSGWSGDLTGTTNPAGLTMDANKNVTATFVQSGGSLTFNPSDDGQVKLTQPGLNFGIKGTAKVQANRFNSYFKFNVTGLTGTVQSAVLRLFVSGESVDGGAVYSVSNNYRGSSKPWVETALTAANAPGITGPALDAVGAVALGTTAEWDVTSAVTGDGVVSFAISSGSDDQAKYDTKDGNVLPQLVIQTGTGGPPQYTLTTSTQGSGAISLNPPGGTYSSGTVVQLTATPAAGWQFSGWSGDLTGTANPASLTMDANKNVTATFTQIPPQQVTLTVTTQGSGSVALNPSGGTYAVGTVVQLTATPAAGWQFSGWSGDLTGTANPASLTMDANKNVTATFTQIPPQQVTLTVTTQGSGSVTLNPPGGTYALGTIVQLTAAPASGWIFSGWSGALTGNISPATLAMDGNKAVTATFAPSVQIPAPPSLLAAAAASTSSIDLSWQDNSNNEDGFKIERKTSTGAFTEITTTAAGVIYYSDTGLPSSTLFTYRVRSFNSAGNSAYSNEASATTATVNQPPVAVITQPANGASFNLGSALNYAGDATDPEDGVLPAASFTWKVIHGGITRIFAQGVKSGQVFAMQPGLFKIILEVKDSQGLMASTNVTISVTESVGAQRFEGLAKESTSPFVDAAALPESYELSQAYPNPFNAEMTIQYALPVASRVRIFIYNVKGQLVRRLVDGLQAPGFRKVRWDGRNDRQRTVSSGLYFIRFNAGGREFTRKAMLQK